METSKPTNDPPKTGAENKAVETPENESEEKKSNKTLLMLLIFSGILNVGLFFLYWMEHGNYKEKVVEKFIVVEERDSVKADLVQLQNEYSVLETSDKNLQDTLAAKREQISLLIKEAEKHKGDAYVMAKLKRETETLRAIMKGYIRTIDSLNTANKNLYAENIKTNTKLLSEKEKNEQITKEKEDLQTVINKGSILTANAVHAAGVHYRSGGKKEIETTKARKTEKIKVSFVIGENRIAQKGKRDVFLRVLTPDGKELARSMDDANSFSFNGVRGFFCDRQTLNYENNAANMSMYAVQKSGFPAGKYLIQVFCEGSQIGETALTLE